MSLPYITPVEPEKINSTIPMVNSVQVIPTSVPNPQIPANTVPIQSTTVHTGVRVVPIFDDF